MVNVKKTEAHESCCKIGTTACPCQICGNSGRRVASLTLDNHVPFYLRSDFGDTATFCMNPSCNVVYCNGDGKIIRKGETVFPVTVKDRGDEVNVCYCFDFKRSDIRRDILEKGVTAIPDKIKKGVQEGLCDCERKNPQGACCLGNVTSAIKEIKTELGSGSP